MEDTDLTEQTRRTAKEEELRKQRISERQALVSLERKIRIYNHRLWDLKERR